MGNWKDEANKLYFTEKLPIIVIAEKLGKTRKTISVYLQEQDGFKEEKERRKAENHAKRPEYKKTWEQTNRGSNFKEDEGAMLKRQHNIDVAVLSYERI